MINISAVRSVSRFLGVTGIGIVASLMASAIMNIYYYSKFSGSVSGFQDLRNWAIAGGCIGILAGIIFNRLTLSKGFSQRDTQLISLAFVRLVITALIVIGISLSVWYFYRVDYFPLKDNGPLALIAGLVLGMWDLLSRTSHR